MLHTLNNIVLIASAALLAYIAWNIYSQYRLATGSTWVRLLAAARNSATILWGKFCIALALVVGNLDAVADALGAPQITTFINTWIGNPKAIAAIMASISIVSMAARLRPGSSNKI